MEYRQLLDAAASCRHSARMATNVRDFKDAAEWLRAAEAFDREAKRVQNASTR